MIRLVLVCAVFALCSGSAFAHSIAFCFNADPCNGQIELALGTYHTDNVPTGGVYLTGGGLSSQRFNFNGVITTNWSGLPAGFSASDCDVCAGFDYTGVYYWQTVTVNSLTPDTYTVMPSTDTAIEYPYCGAFTVTLSPTGNAISCASTDTVAASAPPSCSAVSNYAPPSCIFDAGCGFTSCSVSLVSGQLSGSSFPFGSTSNQYQLVLDGSPFDAYCSTTVDVTDQSGPSNVVCPSPVSTVCTGPSGATVTYSAVGGETDCTGVGSGSFSPSSGSTFPIGTTSVVYTVFDTLGYASTCSFPVTITSNPPALTSCPADMAVTSLNSAGMGQVNYTPPTAQDGCTSPLAMSHTSGPAPGDWVDPETLPSGVATVVWTSDPDPVTSSTVTCQFEVEFQYARITSILVLQSAAPYELTTMSSPVVPLYIPLRISWALVNIPASAASSASAQVTVIDSTSTSKNFENFVMNALQIEIIGLHNMYLGTSSIGISTSSMAVSGNWFQFELVALLL